MTQQNKQWNIKYLVYEKGQVVDIQALIKISTDQYKALKNLTMNLVYGSNLSINGVIDTVRVDINTLIQGQPYRLAFNLAGNNGAFTTPRNYM